MGSHEEVADRIEEYAALGLDQFVLSGYPNLEEAFHFGEGVIPELLRRGVDIKNQESRVLEPVG